MSGELGHDLPVVDPSTGETIAQLKSATTGQLAAAVDRARTAQASWAAESVQTRCNRLLDWRQALLKASDDLARQLTRENGKPFHEAWLHEVAPFCNVLSWLADEGPRWLDDTEVSLRWMKHQRSVLWSKPRGLCAVISPYNFPLLIPFSDAAAALLAGCAVIVKPSERTPLIARSVAELAERSGLPPGLLQVVFGGAEVAQRLIESGVDEVTFTGSSAHGRSVALQCAERLVPCTLELGGGAPAVVFEDANIEHAATAITFGALANSGQSCIAIERVYTPRFMHSELVDAITARVSKLRQGNPLHEEVDLGAMTSERQLTTLGQHIDAAVVQGARLVHGGGRAGRIGNFFTPTVLADCDPDMTVVSGEMFGPVIPIVPVDDPSSMLTLANRGSPSLAAYLFGSDSRALNVAARRSTANHVLLNDVLWSYLCPELPFGGHGQGGWGVVHGFQGLLAHTHRAHIGQTRVRLPGKLGFGFPYARAPRTFIKHAMRLFNR